MLPLRSASERGLLTPGMAARGGDVGRPGRGVAARGKPGAVTPVKLPAVHKVQSEPQLHSRRSRGRDGGPPQGPGRVRQQVPRHPAAPPRSAPRAPPRAAAVGAVVERQAAQDLLPEREAKRRALESLTSPQLEAYAKKAFMAQMPDPCGNLGPDESRRALRILNQKMGSPLPSDDVAEPLFKKFDFNGDGSLNFAEFFELLVSCLRRLAFDSATLFGRDVFISKQPGKVWDQYSCLQKIGTGSFGAAYLAQHKRTGDQRVIKAAGKSQVRVPVEDVEREIMVMQQLDHPHVVRLYEWYEGGTSLYLVLDALAGGTLHEVIMQKFNQKANVSEQWIRTVLQQSLEAMAYCHSKRIMHKDLKDENIMLLQKDPDYSAPHAMIIDLGVSEMFGLGDPKGKLMAGTPTTMAPEVWSGSFGPKCDVWSLGCVLYELLAGDMPFCANSFNPKDWIALQRKGPRWDRIKTSGPSVELCRTMLKFGEADRPNMAECLKHRWFSLVVKELKSVSPAQLAPLKKFSETNALKRAVLYEIAARLPMKSADKIVKFFSNLDENSDGSIDKAELERGLKQLGLKDPDVLSKTFQLLDVDGDGVLSLNEFSAGVLLVFSDLLEDRFRALFRRYDEDCDGHLDREELRKLLSSSAPLATGIHNGAASRQGGGEEQTLEEMLRGSDGHLSYEEVKRKILG